MRRTPGLRDIHNTKARSLLALQAASLFALLFVFFVLLGKVWRDGRIPTREELRRGGSSNCRVSVKGGPPVYVVA